MHRVMLHRWFFAFVCATMAATTLQFALCIWLFVDSFGDDWYRTRRMIAAGRAERERPPQSRRGWTDHSVGVRARGGGRAWPLYATPPSPPKVLTDSGRGGDVASGPVVVAPPWVRARSHGSATRVRTYVRELSRSRAGGESFVRGQVRRENFVFPFGDEKLPPKFFCGTSCSLCVLSGGGSQVLLLCCRQSVCLSHPSVLLACSALPHCLWAVGSGAAALHRNTACGQWAVQLLQYTASLPE